MLGKTAKLLSSLFLLKVAGAFVFMPATAHSSAPMKRITVKFEYRDFPLRMEIHDVAEKFADSVALTEVVGKPEQVPSVGVRPDVFELGAMEEKSFLLVMKNSTGDDKYFFAVPHLALPAEGAGGIFFECLCNSSVYKIPPGKTWYRVVRLQMEKRLFPAPVALVHSIVGVSAKDANSRYKARLHDN